tara:strand:- start:102 stop:287 length:186 start_codon:yes stop_codon:yes gene_type:complete
MDALKRTLIEKAGHDFGFEYTIAEIPVSRTLGSARHSLHAEVTLYPLHLRKLRGRDSDVKT